MSMSMSMSLERVGGSIRTRKELETKPWEAIMGEIAHKRFSALGVIRGGKRNLRNGI
jgi:hypothetical protein